MCLLMNGNQRNMAMVGEFLSMACFEQSGHKVMPLRHSNDDIDVTIHGEAADRIQEVEQAHKIKLWIVISISSLLYLRDITL